MTIAPEGRRLLRIEARNSQTPIERKPEWIKTRAKMGPEYTALRSLVVSEGLHTVCQEAACPNIFECWEDREATFLIGGDACTRRCDFCNIDTGKPLPLDRDEPGRVCACGTNKSPRAQRSIFSESSTLSLPWRIISMMRDSSNLIFSRNISAWRSCKLTMRWLCGLVICTAASKSAWRRKKSGVLAR